MNLCGKGYPRFRYRSTWGYQYAARTALKSVEKPAMQAIMSLKSVEKPNKC